MLSTLQTCTSKQKNVKEKNTHIFIIIIIFTLIDTVMHRW